MIWMFRLSIFWLGMALFLVTAWWTLWIPYWQAGYYGMLVLVTSAVMFLLNGFDKMQARRKGSRVPEKFLHLLEFLGGWPGAHFGQQLFRHKTFKPAYRKLFWMIVVLHIVLVCLVFYLTLPSTPASSS